MRLLVCGGRAYDNVPFLWLCLHRINAKRIAEHCDGIRCLIDGGQVAIRDDGADVGADHWAYQWACATNTPTERYFADWKGLGRAAGPMRNQRMIDEGKPDALAAFEGGRGTADMIRRAKAAGIPVWETWLA